MANNIGSKLDALRNKRREEEEEEQRKAANVGASLDALRNKRQTEEAAKTVDVSAWNNFLSDSGTKEKIKASREFAEETVQNTPAKQKETKDALAIRNQEAKVDKLAREEEAKRKAYNDLPLIDRVMNISADEYSSDEARQKKAAEVELDRMRLTPEEFEKQHKADLGESLYQIAHSAAAGVAGSFARAADVGVALVEGTKQAGRWVAGEGDEKSSVAREFTKGYQRSLVEDSLYDEVYDQYEREYQRNREIDGEVNALTKYTAQAAQSVGEQAVMLWTASLGGALWTGSKAATTVAKVSDDLMNSGKKAVQLLGRALGKFDAGALSGPASMLVTTSASSTADAIKAMRAKNEQRISNGLEAEYSEDDIARKAALYGVLNGLSETTLEYALGGVTGAAKGILPTGKVKNPILTATLSYLKGAAGEGVEEMVQTLASTGLQNLTYNAETTVNWTEVLESGIVGAISGLGMSAPSFVQNTRLGVSAMHDIADTVKAADKADSDVAQGFVALAASSKAAAYAETAQAMRSTGSENAETLASIYDWASEQQAKIAKSLTGEETGAQIKEKAAENKNEAPSPAPTESASLVPPDATQTEAQVITTDVQNKVRREAVQRENVSAENGGATVVSELTQKIKNVAPKANIQTVQKLVDAVHLVQTGTMPDKSYNEALNLLRDERVLRTVAAEIGGDFAVDTKNKTTIRASLEAVAKRYAETAEQADMDSLSEEISHAVATLPNYQSPARSASDAITVEGGQITRAEFVRNYGAALAQQGRAADDVFDNLLAAEQTPNADVNAPIQTAEMPAMTSAAPNADVNAINRDANTFEQEANAPIQTAEQGTSVPNADVNAINRETNTFERDANAPIQTAESDVSRETISPNATERGVHRLFSEKTPLTEIQRESIQALEMLSRAVNVDIYLYDSAVDTEYGYSSGRYDTGTDRVYVDINAGAHYEGTILRTAGHELTHYLKRWSPEGFEDLSAFIEMTLTESGADIAALMEGKKANALKHGNEISDDIAYEEVIADACQMLLTDSDALYRLSEQNKTLFERVMDFFKEFLDNLRSVYSGYKPTTEAGRIMAAQTQDVMDMLSEVYSDALIRAGKARTEAQKMISGEQSIFADAKTEQGSDLFDYRAMQADMIRYEQMLTEWGGMSDKDVSRLMAMIGHTVDVVSENAQKLDYGYDTDPKAERPFNPVKKNSDDLYKISIDFSTLCRKRIVQSIVAQNLESALERPLSKEEAIQIREALIEVQKDAKTVEVACALCYVEAARLKTPEQVTKVLQNLPTVMQRYYAAKNGDAKKAVADAEKAAKVGLGLPEDKTIKSIKDKDVAPRGLTAKEAKAAIRAAKKAALDNFALTDVQRAEIEYAQTLPVTAFTTAKGLYELAQKHHDVYKAYADAVRSASRSKGLEADVPWRAGDADSISDNLITSMNEGAGVRSQSWSDFQAIHLLDVLATTIEMATHGAKMHSYTKVPDYVRLLGKTGHMINMSLIPTRDGEGFDPSEGMPYETMLRLRDQYPDTAGNICIGVNDEQILRLLDSDEIDYVIPYHKSGNSKATRKLLKIPEWSDYEGIQGEKGDGEKPVFRDWFDIEKARATAARENASPTDPAAKEKYGVQYGAYKAMQEAADRYLQICTERGLTPKFKGKVEGRNVDFTTHPNYWKLLIDRKMVNQITGEIIEQKPVQPIFDPAVIYGDPADGNVGGILGRALEYYDVHQADTAYAVETVTRAMAENKDTEIGQELSGKQKILDQIIGDSVEDIRNGDTLFEYRETDETYQRAVEAGDTEKEDQIIEATALANGYTEVVFHGSGQFGFTELDVKYSDDGISFFATPDLQTAQTYSGNPNLHEIKDGAAPDGSGNYRFYGNMDGFLIVDGGGTRWNQIPAESVPDSKAKKWFDVFLYETRRELASRQLSHERYIASTKELLAERKRLNQKKRVLDEKLKNLEKDNPLFNKPTKPEHKGASSTRSVYGLTKVDKLKIQQDQLESSIRKNDDMIDRLRTTMSVNDAEMTILNERIQHSMFTTRSLAKFAHQNGYKGVLVKSIIDDGGRGERQQQVSDIYNFFDPARQLKSADPVTYDNDGKVIPPSKRFDPENKDVRFEYRESDETYLTAAEAGDTETAQRMVDEAADKAMPGSILREGAAINKGEEEEGTLIKMYHGSGANDFNTFEPKDGMLGKGVYLTSNWDEAVGYALEKLGVEENDDGYYEWNGEEYDGIGGIGEALEGAGYVRAFYANVTDEADISKSAVYWEDVIALVRDTTQLKSADPVTYDDKGNVIPLSERFSSENDDIRYDYRVSGNEATEPHASQRDIASSPEFEAFVKAYDAVHGEGAARTIVRTTEQFDRERARQRKREATAAQMARLPETEAKLRRMAEAAERSRKDESKINAIKNPAVRRAKLSAHLAKQEAEAIRRVAEIDAQMRVADQAYRDSVEMHDRLAEQKARAEERLKGVKADYKERLDRERVRTAQAKFEGKQNASERVQRERYKQWWRNRIHEEDLRQARAEGRENVRQAREEERSRAAEHAQQVRDYRAFRNRNADVINEQRQNRHNTYPTGDGAIGNMIDRKQAAYNERAARDQADFEREYQLGQAEAINRTGVAPTSGAPETVVKPYLSTADTSATPPGNTFKPVPTKTGKVVEAVKGLPEKTKQAVGTAYRLLVNSAQPLDDIAKKQEKAGFLATASDYVTSARNAPAVASYIISEGLTDKSGNPIGKSLADVVLVHGAGDVTFGGETVKAQQAFQDYLLHKHNVDRMSFTVRAKQDLDALIEENPWIPDFVDETTSEFTRELYGLSEEQREIVARWADLNRRFREAKNKPIFPAENDTVWTAEQSQARVDLYEAEQSWMKGKAEELYQWWDTFMREYAVGVSITAEEYEAMRTLYPHYVPTYREGKSIGKSTNAVAGSVSAGKAVHEAKGGTSEVRWIQDTLAEQVMKIVGLQKQNALLLNLVDSAMLDSDGTMFPGLRVTPESMGYSTLMTAEDLDNADHQMQTLSKNPDGTYTVTAWDNGNRISVYVSEDVYNALFSMFGQKSKGYQLALTAGRKLSTPMKSMITGYNPAFGVRNVVRDVATGLIQAEGGTFSGMGSYAANYVRAWNQIASGSDAWNAFKAQGGAGSTHYRAEDGLSSHAEKMMTPGWAGRVKGALGWFNETSESAARFAAYLQYLKAHGDTPENRIRAIHSAAEITTDFSRSGDIGKLLNAWVPYSNAATQGVDRVLRDFTQGKAVNRLTRAAIVQGIPAAIIGLVVKGLGREDEYDEISDYHKDNYYLIPIPDGKWIRLPKTPFYGTLLTSGVSRAVEGVLGREDPFDGFGATAAEAFNLPGAGAETLPEAVSSVVRDVVGIGPMLDLHMNKNFIGQDIVPSEFKDYSSGKFAPNNTQYNDETSAVAMVLSKMMLSAVSPIQMDYLMKSYMGDFYHGIASIVDVGLLRSFTAEDLGKNLFDATLGETGSSFVVDPAYSNRYTGEYYDMLDAMAAQIAADKVHLPEGEHKNTLTYHTKQAIENKYGKSISAAYKAARSAVSEAQKRDAREEAVMLSIEALDFYERAMAGKYGSDPSKYVKYEQYGEDVCEALLQLTPYEAEFTFEPNASSAPSSLTVDKVKYELTAEQRDEYKALYVRTYSALARQAISSQEYRMAGARRRAELLEGVASEAREQTRENYKMILSGK